MSLKYKHLASSVLVNGQKVSVDKGIIPVVEWLNNFPGIITNFSCEGYESREEFSKPYVQFIVNNLDSLIAIFSILSRFQKYYYFGEEHLEFDYYGNFCNLYWGKRKHLKSFIKYLKKNDNKSLQMR